MKKNTLILILSICFWTCGEKKAEETSYEAADSTAPIYNSEEASAPSIESKSSSESNETNSESITSSAAKVDEKNKNRKFVRTAEIKFKVKNVLNSTYDIENIVIKNGGFVTYTNLSSNIENSNTVVISEDTTLETTYYTVTNSFTLRVPNTKLDTTLREISRNIEFLDFRIIKADDVALQLLANNLTQKRIKNNEDRLTNAIDKKGKKLTEITESEEQLLNKQEQADNAKISNLQLDDQINFSTITLNIYQRQTIKRELIANEKNIKSYEQGLGSKIISSLKFGWEILEAFLLFLIKIWGFIILGIIAFFAFKLYKNKTQNKS